jgi:hypothetical protein
VAVLGEEGAPALAIKITSPHNFANPGDENIAFRVSAVNAGDLTAFGVKVVAALGQGLGFSGMPGSSRQWQFDSILPHETKNIDFTAAEPGFYTIAVSAGAANNEAVSESFAFEIRPVEVLSAETGPAATAAAADRAAGETALPVTGADYESILVLFLNFILGLFIFILTAIFRKNQAKSS